jgi:hypothetical protein
MPDCVGSTDPIATSEQVVVPQGRGNVRPLEKRASLGLGHGMGPGKDLAEDQPRQSCATTLRVAQLIDQIAACAEPALDRAGDDSTHCVRLAHAPSGVDDCSRERRTWKAGDPGMGGQSLRTFDRDVRRGGTSASVRNEQVDVVCVRETAHASELQGRATGENCTWARIGGGCQKSLPPGWLATAGQNDRGKHSLPGTLSPRAVPDRRRGYSGAGEIADVHHSFAVADQVCECILVDAAAFRHGPHYGRCVSRSLGLSAVLWTGALFSLL